jgi:NIPSNAP
MPCDQAHITDRGDTVITCIIRYHIDPARKELFEAYARAWGQAIPRCGADFIGYYAPHEGSTTRAYGVYSIESLTAYEQYKARLRPILSRNRTSPLPNESASSCVRIVRS